MAGKHSNWIGAVALAALATVVAGPLFAQGTSTPPFTLSTIDSNGGLLALAQVNSEHGCTGGNAPPTLLWSAVPSGTKSFAVTMFDETARNGAGFWHWALFDISAQVRTLDSKQTPPGAKSGRNDYGDAGYGGACPPAKDAPHHYVLTVWALGVPTIPFDAGSSDKEIGDYLQGHALGNTTLTLAYKR